MRNSIIYRRLWYVGKRNIKRMQTFNRVLLAIMIFMILMLFANIEKIPVTVILP